MRERQILESMLDMADLLYHKTGDKWWLHIGVEVAKKLNSGRKYDSQKKIKQ